jgi:acyl-homoserine-lactone acylase
MRILFAFLLTFCFNYIHAQYNVEIVRDSFGVPHIFGKTDADVAYGLAWAECEDDFKTLQFSLMLAKGCLGRHIGIDGAKIDFAVQLMRVRRTLTEKYGTDVSPEFKKILEAGCVAVNKYAKLHPEEILVKQAFPADPLDILSGYMLSQALMVGIDGALAKLVDGNIPKVNFAEFGKGSNAMAFNSAKTADGNVYLDINSHQPLEGPLSWYEAHLCSEEGWNIMGSTFHGGISIFHGANEYLGWAHTINSFDGIDLFELQPDPNKKGNYLIDGVSHKLEKGRAKMAVNLAKNKEKNKFIIKVGKNIWWSKYGATVVTKKGIFALRLGSNMTIKAAEQWYKMNKAKSFTEWMDAVKMQGVVNQHFCYADKFDTIYILSNVTIPYRHPDYNWSGTVPGNTEKTLLNKFYPIDSLAQVLMPKSGYVFNANQTSFQLTAWDENPDSTRIPKNLGYGKEENNRSRRFYENMELYKDQKVSWDDFLKIKYDSRYPKEFVFFRNYNVNDLFTMSEKEYPDVQDVIAKFKTWDKSCGLENKNAPICFSTLYNAYNRSNDSMVSLFQTNQKEKFVFLAKCMKDARDTLVKYFGSIDVPLGDYQRHVRGNIELPLDGGPDLWNAKYGNPFKDGKIKVWLGESYILLVKFKKDGPNEYYSVSPYGASNKPNSPHFTDQMELYANKKLKTMTLDKATIYKNAEKIYRP